MAGKQDQKVVAAALAGDDSALMARLAEGYYYGRGRDKSLKLALQLWQKASELGNADALYYYGVCHYYGDGLPRDKAMAFHLWEQAVKQGSAAAQESLDTLRGAAEDALPEEP